MVTFRWTSIRTIRTRISWATFWTLCTTSSRAATPITVPSPQGSASALRLVTHDKKLPDPLKKGFYARFANARANGCARGRRRRSGRGRGCARTEGREGVKGRVSSFDFTRRKEVLRLLHKASEHDLQAAAGRQGTG